MAESTMALMPMLQFQLRFISACGTAATSAKNCVPQEVTKLSGHSAPYRGNPGGVISKSPTSDVAKRA